VFGFIADHKLSVVKGGIRPYVGYLEQGSRFWNHNLAKTHYYMHFFGFLLVGPVTLKKPVRALV
jgi:hypothetical protein